MKYTILYLCLFALSIGNSKAQALERRIALLNLDVRNSETNDSRLFSAMQMLKVAGIPFQITDNPEIAKQSAMILCSSKLIETTFTAAEKNMLENYVSDGGILVAPEILDEDLFPLFGISEVTESLTNYRINWNVDAQNPLFRWMDEPEEQTISLGKPSTGNIFKTYAYEVTNAFPMAHYENNTVAVTQHKSGNGVTYTVGMAWKDLIMRSQINRDYEAQRITSNGFEPTQDVLMLFMRNIFCEHIPYSTWKHTSFANSTSTLMITHDIDSSTAVDSLPDFAESEEAMGIAATYNVTLRYFSDALMTDYYIGSAPVITDVLNKGHSIGSHSVGHFFDFANEDLFPFGSSGNTMANYTPFNDGVETIGGNVFAECEVSKNVLEADHGVTIKTFRAGHLAYPKYLVNVLDSLGYLYNSSHSANDVLTNFPYQTTKSRSFSGEHSSVYELPVSISDVFQSDPITVDNYLEKADIWLDVLSKINANQAPTVLLIHPNRGYKLLGQEYFLSQIPASIYIAEMSAFGDFWKAREAFDFGTQLSNDSLYLTVSNQDLSSESISLVINNGQDLSAIIIQDEDGNSIDFIAEDWEENDVILYRYNIFFSHLKDVKKDLKLKLYPNPAQEQLFIEMDLKIASNVQVEILDQAGKLVKQTTSNEHTSGHRTMQIDLNDLPTAEAIYFCKIDAGANGIAIRKVFLKK